MKQHLRKGNYIVFNGTLIIPLNIHNILLTLKRLVRHRLMAKIRIISAPEETNGSLPKGNRLLSRKWDGQMLIFDDEAKWVFRKYTNTEQVTSLKKGFPSLEKFYQINKVYFIDSHTTKESLLKGITLRKAEPFRQNEIFQDIIDQYQKAIIENKYEHFAPQITSEDFFERLSTTNYPEEMKDYILLEKIRITALLERLKWIWNHCDLSPDNILVTGKQYYLIDSEWCDTMPVLYDIINLLLTLETMSNNIIPIENYFKGKYDVLLKAILNKEDIEYADRTAIFLIMLVLKAILAWDAKRKHNNKKLLYRRWETVKSRILYC